MVREERRVPTRAGVTLRVITRPGLREGVPFLLVHGLASNARMWDGVADRLCRAGHPAAAVDQRGHGGSDRVDDGFDFTTLADDLASVATAVFERPAVVAGQSWGGNVALEFAHRHPELVAGLALVDGGFIALADPFPDWDEAARLLAPPDLAGTRLEDLEAAMRARFAGWPEEGILGQLANFEVLADGTVHPHLTRERHMRILEELWRHHPDQVADGLDLPMVVIAADDDWPGKRERVAAFAGGLRHGRVVWVDGHHDVHAERPDLVAGLLLELAEAVDR
jgi:pimeloyl-ACP methyl ester carboxylesterase